MELAQRIIAFIRRHLRLVVPIVVIAVIGIGVVAVYIMQQPSKQRNGAARTPASQNDDSATGQEDNEDSEKSSDGDGQSKTPSQDKDKSDSGTAGSGGTGGSSTGGSNGNGQSGGSGNSGGTGGGSGGSGGTTSGCPALPAYPDASCTGWEHTGVTLTTITPSTPVDGAYFDPDGNMNVTEDGKVIDGIRFDGCIFIRADNVTIKRSLLTRGWCAEGTISAQLGSYTNITIEDVEIDGENEDPGFSGISGNNFTCLRCNIHNVGTPIRAAANVTVTDSYLHDNSFGGSSHNTGMSMHEGGNVIVRHTNIRCNAGGNCTGAFEINSRDSYINTGVVIDDVLLENNLFYTDTGYCLYGGWDNHMGTPTHATNIHVINNAFQYTASTCGDLGVVANWAPTSGNAASAGNVWSGNFVYPNKSNLISPY
jgi:hypothetical protein